MLKKIVIIGIFAVLLLPCGFPTQAVGAQEEQEDLLAHYRVVAKEADRANLVGFIPMDHQPSYDFQMVSSSEEVISEVLEGDALLGFLSPLEYMKARQKGLPLIVVESPFQIAPIAFAVKKNVFNRDYSSFSGKRVRYEVGSEAEFLFRHLLREIGLTFQDVVWVPHDSRRHKSYADSDIVILDNLKELVKFENYPETDFILYPNEFNINYAGPLLVAKHIPGHNSTALVQLFATRLIENLTSNIFNRKNIYSLFLQKSIPYVFQNDRQVGDILEEDWWQMQRVALEEGVLLNPVRILNYADDSAEIKMSLDKDVEIALPGLPDADFAGFYMAEDRGYYGRLKRDVELAHYPSEKDVVAAVREGEVEMGVISAYSLLQAQAENPEFKLLGVIFQEDPATLIALSKELGANQDQVPGLINQDIVVADRHFGAFLSFIQPLPVGMDEIRYTEGYSSVFGLLDGRAGAILGRHIFEDVRISKIQKFFQAISNRSFPVVGLCIFARESSSEVDLMTYRKIAKATFHGYENSIYQSDQATQALMNRDPSLSHSQVYSIITQNTQYLKDDSGIIGPVNLQRWRQLTDAALNKGLLLEEPEWSQFFHKDLREAWEKM